MILENLFRIKKIFKKNSLKAFSITPSTYDFELQIIKLKNRLYEDYFKCQAIKNHFFNCESRVMKYYTNYKNSYWNMIITVQTHLFYNNKFISVNFYHVSLFLLVSLNELEIKMLNMALKQKPSCASEQTKNKSGEGFEDQMLINEIYEAEYVHYSHPRSQTTLSNWKQSIAVENEYKTKGKQVVLPDDAVLSKKFSENVTVKKVENRIPKKSENILMTECLETLYQTNFMVKAKKLKNSLSNIQIYMTHKTPRQEKSY